jgi:hypothetical protein
MNIHAQGRRLSCVLAAAAMLSSSCGEPARAQVLLARDGTHVLIAGHDDSAGGADARISGKLAVINGHCLGIAAQGQQTGNGTIVAWPEGTEVEDADVLTIKLPNGTQLHLNDSVTGGGGVVTNRNSGGLVPPVPTDCGESQDVFLIDF